MIVQDTAMSWLWHSLSFGNWKNFHSNHRYHYEWEWDRWWSRTLPRPRDVQSHMRLRIEDFLKLTSMVGDWRNSSKVTRISHVTRSIDENRILKFDDPARRIVEVCRNVNSEKGDQSWSNQRAQHFFQAWNDVGVDFGLESDEKDFRCAEESGDLAGNSTKSKTSALFMVSFYQIQKILETILPVSYKFKIRVKNI